MMPTKAAAAAGASIPPSDTAPQVSVDRPLESDGDFPEPITRVAPFFAPRASPASPSVQRPVPPQLTLASPRISTIRQANGERRTSYIDAASPNGANMSDDNEFAVAGEPSPVLANPTLGLTSLSEALAHLVDHGRRGSIGDASERSTAAKTLPDEKYAKSPEGGGTVAGSSRCSTAFSSETGLTSPSGRSQAAFLSPSSPASTTTAKAPTHLVSHRKDTMNDKRDGFPAAFAMSPEEDGKAMDFEDSASHQTSAPQSTEIRPSPPKRHVSDTAHSAVNTAGPTLSAATALLQKVSTSAGPSSGKSSGQNSEHVSGISTPVSRPRSRQGAQSKHAVLETHHLQLQTHEPTGRRMINQYVIENELGRGVHGKVRLARDTETGERVAVKIVEREGKRRLGGLGKNSNHARGLRSAKGKEPAYRPLSIDDEAGASASIVSEAIKAADTPGASSDNAILHARFAAHLPTGSKGPSSPTSTIGGARYGRWGEGASSRPTFADLELERQRDREREKARKRMLWTTDQKVKREIAIMKKCAHENVVRLKEVIDDPQSKKIFMVLEYMEGGEISWKDERGFPTLTVDETRRAVRDVVLGLEYLHYQGIIHRDIKPANLLCDVDGRVKISDFGVSHFSYAMLVARGGLPSYDDDDDADKTDPSLLDDRELAKTAGSPAFFAPELCMASDPSGFPRSRTTQQDLSEGRVPAPESMPSEARQKRPSVTKAIDLWALGVTLYCLLFGHVPFTADSEYALFAIIAKDDYALPAYMGADRVLIGPRKRRWTAVQSWMDEEGDVDPDSSRDIEEDVDDSLLDEEAKLVRDLLDRLLEKDPAKRIKLEEVKMHPWLVQDIADPPAWFSETNPAQRPFVQVSHEEVQGALTGFSKLKQTMKRLQTKFISALSGHHAMLADVGQGADFQGGHTPIYERRNQTLRLHRRPRSKSASIADGDDRSDLQQIAQAHKTAPESPNIPLPAPVSAKVSPTAYMSHSTRGRFPFVRRRSLMLDAVTQDLEALQKAQHTEVAASHAQDLLSRDLFTPEVRSQIQSPVLERQGHDLDSTAHLSRDMTDSSLVWVEGGLESAEMAGSKPPKRPHRFFKRALSRTTQHARPSTDSARQTVPRNSTPSSIGSLHTGESKSAHGIASAPGSGEIDWDPTAQGRSDIMSRQSSASRSKPPSRQRSRTRLGDVFRHVWHVPHHRHLHSESPVGPYRGSSDVARSSKGSRPGTASSQDAAHALQQGVATSSTSSRTARGSDMNLTGLSPAPSGVLAEVGPDNSTYDRPGEASAHHNAPGHYSDDIEREKHEFADVQSVGIKRPPAVYVDEYDVDLDLSDDDIEDGTSMQGNTGAPLLHLNRSGWITGEMQRRHSGTNESEHASSFGLSTTDSLTPSVEGGYNLFKPPYLGASKRARSSDAAAANLTSGQIWPQDASQYGGEMDDGFAENLASAKRDHALARTEEAVAEAVAVADISVMSDDRFADADETDDEEAHNGNTEAALDDRTYHQEALTDVERSYAPQGSSFADHLNIGSHNKEDFGMPAASKEKMTVRRGKSEHVAPFASDRHLGEPRHVQDEDEDEDEEEACLNFRARRTAATG